MSAEAEPRYTGSEKDSRKGNQGIMKKSLRKPLALLLCLTLLGALAAACGGSGGSQQPGGDAASSVPKGFDAMKLYKYDPPITLTFARQVGPDVKFKYDETLEDNVFTRWLEEKMGIKIDLLWTTPTTNDAYKTKLMLSLSAGEELPDFLTVPAEFVHDLIDSGKFRPVDDLFEQYASEKWKAAMDEVQNVWLPYKRDGRAYAIPMIESSLIHDDVMWIRQDWLEKLGLQAPTNLEELERVMDAFVNGDPDGNGVKDTIAVAAAGKNVKYNYTSWLGLNGVYGALNTYMSVWHKNEDGDIVYGTTTPQMKDALALTKDWIDKGYLHQEFGIHDEVKAIELFTSGKAGIAFAASWSYDWPFNEVEKNIEGAKVWPYPLPNGPDGTPGQIGNALNHWLVTLINKDMEHPEALFMYQNYMYEHYEDPAVGSEFEHGFAKGYDWDIVDGEVVTGGDVPGGSVDPQLILLKPATPSKHIRTLAGLAEGKEPTTPYEIKRSKTAKQTMESARIVVSQTEHTIVNLFTGAPTPTMREKQEYLDKLEAEMYSKIIYGREPIDYFDEWVKTWYEQRGEQITQEVRQWYAEAGGE